LIRQDYYIASQIGKVELKLRFLKKKCRISNTEHRISNNERKQGNSIFDVHHSNFGQASNARVNNNALNTLAAMVIPGKKRLFYLSILTLFGMSAIGMLLIHYAQHKGIRFVLLGGKRYYLQMLAGLFFGTLSSLLALLLVRGKRFKSVRTLFENLLHEISPTMLNILFYSLCASIGEEVLFRAGVQPLMGIWPTAFLFIFLHGYINPYNMSLTIYGIFLIVICAGFGYLFKFFGLAASALAHFVYDVAMFSLLKYSYDNN
jgi:hypothetical protein